MKKLMIAFAALVCAVAANAATVNWQSGTMNVAGAADGTIGSTAVGKDTVTAYLFELTAADYATASAMDTLSLYAKYVTEGSVTPTASAKSSSMSKAANIKQSNVADSSGKHYGLIIYEDLTTAQSFDGVDAFVKTAFATVDVAASGTFSATNLASQQANWSAVTQSVPEPTSGLLLLLGMAGLALRRKHA